MIPLVKRNQLSPENNFYNFNFIEKPYRHAMGFFVEVRIRNFKFVVLSFVLLPGPLSAQIIFQPTGFTYDRNLDPSTRILSNMRMGQKAAALRQKPSQNVVPLKAATTFTPSAARTRANLANFAKKSRAADPQGAAKMEALFASTDVIGMVGQGIAPYGLKTNNVADAYAVYWISAWEASRGIAGASETRQRAQAVRTQAINAMAAVPAMATATDAQKQEFAEAMLVQAALISAYMDDAAGNPAQIRAVGAAVAKGAKAMGLDLDTMALTPNGFVPAKGRKRSDAGDGVGGDANGDTMGKKG
jgi:hypothetical protein